MKKINQKKLVVFDLDGTLAPSKAAIDAEMDRLFTQLLMVKKVAVIGGGKYDLFKSQLITKLTASKPLLKNLFLFPTTSTAFYRYDSGWKNVYRHELSKEERTKIKKAFKEVFKESGYIPPKKTYGKVLEDRGTQVTFSALGQEIVAMLGKKEGVRLKEKWKNENTPIKLKMAKMLAARLPKLEVHAAGFTSIDVTRKGIDKAYGMRQIEKYLRIPIKDMVFIGDALFPGGNDYAVKKTGVQAIPVSGPEETKKIIRAIIQK
jgi:HAD superfamily hydrolase (TIGR01484 family)